MAAIRIEGLNSVAALITDLGPGLERANERAQNKMAYTLMQAEREQAKSDLDRPVPAVISSILYKKYGASSISFSNPSYTVSVPNIKGAGVFVGNLFAKTLATFDSVLGVQIEGGPPAGPKRSAKVLQQFGFMPRGKVWVPALGAPMDAYGNLRGSLLSFMLQNMGTNPYAPVTDENKFIVMGEPGQEYDIYWKGSASRKQKGGAWRPLLWFINPPTYQPRFKWAERADTEVATNFNGLLSWYIDDELARMAR